MSVKVDISNDGLNRLLSEQNLAKAQATLANQAMSDMDQFVPYKQGHLADGAFIDEDNNIVYTQPYAKAQFYGIIHGSPVKNYTLSEHPLATKRWDLKAKKLYGDAWAAKVRDKLLGGI